MAADFPDRVGFKLICDSLVTSVFIWAVARILVAGIEAIGGCPCG